MGLERKEQPRGQTGVKHVIRGKERVKAKALRLGNPVS